MSTQYVDYLRSIINSLKSKGVDLQVNLDCEKSRLPEQVLIIEQFLYFNNILKRADSIYKIEGIADLPETTSQDIIRKQIFDEYEEEWKKQLEDITAQPKDAGKVNLPVVDAEEFTKALGLVSPEPEENKSEVKESIPYSFKPSSISYEFDEDDDEDDEDDFEDYSSEEDAYEFDDDEEEDDFEDYSSEEDDSNSKDDEDSDVYEFDEDEVESVDFKGYKFDDEDVYDFSSDDEEDDDEDFDDYSSDDVDDEDYSDE